VDAGGVVVDTAATLVPFVPGGAATVIKSKRALGVVEEVVENADETFEIIDGVRRSKAADLVGIEKIPAEIFDDSERLMSLRDVPLNSLRSPHKPTIDVSDADKMGRFMKTLNKTKAGSVPPPIKGQTRKPGI